MDIEEMLKSREAMDQNIEEIKKYIAAAKKEEDWAEVKRLQTRKLELNPDDVRAISDLVSAAKKEGDWAEVKRLQTRGLELNPDNVRAISDLVSAAKKEGDWAEVKRLQTRQLELNPDDVRAISDLVSAAKKKGDWAEVKRLQIRLLELQPDSVRAMGDLVAVAKKEGNWAEVIRIQIRQLELNPDNEVAMQDIIKASKRLGILKSPQQSIESLKEQLAERKPENIEVGEEEFSIESQVQDSEGSGISDIRRRLYAGEIEFSEIKQIAESYQGSARGVILIAEVCTYFGNQKLALQALKGYKKNHENDITREEKTRINTAIGIVSGKQRIKDPVKWSNTYGEGSANGSSDGR